MDSTFLREKRCLGIFAPFWKKKVVGKHIEFVKLQLMQGYRALAWNISFINKYIYIHIYNIFLCHNPLTPELNPPSKAACRNFLLGILNFIAYSSQFVNFDAETFPFLCNILPEDNSAFEFYNYLIHCQMLRGITEFSISLVQLVKDGP